MEFGALIVVLIVIATALIALAGKVSVNTEKINEIEKRVG